MAGNNGYFVAQADGKCRRFYRKNKLSEFKAAHGLATNAHRSFRNIYDAMSFMADPDMYVSHPLAYRVEDGKVSLVKKRSLNWAVDDYNTTLFRLCTPLSRDMLIEDVKLYGRPRRRLEEFSRPTILARCMAARTVPPEEAAAELEVVPSRESQTGQSTQPPPAGSRPWYSLYADASVRLPAQKDGPVLAGYGLLCLNPDGSELFHFSKHEEVVGEKANSTQYHELKAIVLGVEHFHKPASIRVYTDQKPFIESLNEGFLFTKYMAIKKGEPVDPLLRKLIEYMFFHNIEFHYVKSHNGNINHDYCDYLASPMSLIRA